MDWKEMTDEQFDEARKARPRAALEYTHACARLTAEQFAEAAKAEPWAAIRCAKDRLEQLQGWSGESK